MPATTSEPIWASEHESEQEFNDRLLDQFEAWWNSMTVPDEDD